MREIDNTIWIPDDDDGITDINDPFSGLRENLLPRLLRDFETWQLDMRILELREGKILGSNKGHSRTRDSIFATRLKSMPNYQKSLKVEKTKGNAEFKRLIAEARRELNLLLRNYEGGKSTFAELERDSTDWFKHLFTNIYKAGRRASGVEAVVPEAAGRATSGEEAWVKSAIQEEVKFWKKFMQEIKDGAVVRAITLPSDVLRLHPPARRYTIEERMDMYIGNMEGVFEAGRVQGLPDDRLYYWVGPEVGDRGICAGCAFIVDNQPYPKSRLPAVPRSGATPCLSRCRHKLLVRKAKGNEILQRERILASKKQLTSVLESIQKSKGRYRPKGAKAYPWVVR